MSGLIGELMVLISGNGMGLTAATAKAEGELRALSVSANHHLGIVGDAFHIAGLAALGIGAGAAIGGALAVKSASDWQDQMAILNTLLHETPQELEKTGDGIRKIADTSNAPIKDLTGSFYDLISANIDAGHSMTILDQANTLSTGSLSTVHEATNLLTTTVNAWGTAHGKAHLALDDSGKAMDTWAQTVALGNVTAADIANNIGNVAGNAAHLNVPIAEVGASMALMSLHGRDAAVSTQEMNGALVALERVPPGMRELQDATHKSYEKIAATKGPHEAFTELVADAQKYHVSLISVMGRQDAMDYVLQTTGSNAKQYGQFMTSVHDSAGVAAAQAAERHHTLSFAVGELGNRVDRLMSSVGTPFLGFLTDVATNAGNGVSAITEWAAQFPSIGDAIGSISLGDVGGRIVGALGDVGGRIGTWIAEQAPGWGAQLMTWGQEFVDWIGPMIPPALAALGRLVDQGVAWISAEAPKWVAQLGKWAGAFIDWISPMVPKVLDELGKLASKAIDWVTGEAPKWVSALLKWADKFLDWIGPLVPKLLDELGKLGGKLVDWVIGEAPKVATALGKMAIEFVQWVVPKIPEMVVELGKLGIALFGWANEQIGKIGDALTKWGLKFIGWIGDSIPGALKALGDWLGQVIGWMGGVGGQFLKAAGDWGASIVKGVMDAIAGLPKSVGDKLSEIPGLSLVGDIAGAASNPLGTAANTLGVIPHADGAWNIPATEIAMLHAGEMVLPAQAAEAFRSALSGAGGAVGPIGGFASIGAGRIDTGRGGGGGEIHVHVHHTSKLELDGRTLAEVVDEHLLRLASGYSSGLIASPGITGA